MKQETKITENNPQFGVELRVIKILAAKTETTNDRNK